MTRRGQAAWLVALTLVDLVALPFAFAGAALSPVLFKIRNAALGWGVTTLFVSFLLVAVLAPPAAWAAYLLKRPRAAWAFGLVPILWIAAILGFSLFAWLG
jgi:hypothetical protein